MVMAKAYGGYATSNFARYKNSLWTTTAQLDYTFADKHNVSFLAGSEEQRRTSLGYGVNRQTLSDSAYNLIQQGSPPAIHPTRCSVKTTCCLLSGAYRII